MSSEAVQHETFTVPVDKVPYDRLTEYARRTVVLLEGPVVQEARR